MSNICEGAAMDKGRYMFQGLYQVRFQGILHEGSHGPLGVDITGSNRFVIIGVAYDDPGKSFLHIPNGISKAEDGHHFGSYGNIKSVFPGNPIGMAAKTYDDMAEHPVIHILHPFPDHPAGIDAQGISLLDMVVHHGSQKIVSCCNGMKVTGEMEVNIFHRNHLGIAAAGSAALNTHAGAKRRFAEADHGLLAELSERLSQSYSGGRLSLSCRGWRNSGHKNQVAHRLIFQFSGQFQRNLRLIGTIIFQIFRRNSNGSTDFCNRFQFCFLCNFNIA